MSDTPLDRSAEHVRRVERALGVHDLIGGDGIALAAIELGAVVKPPEKPKSKVREAIEAAERERELGKFREHVLAALKALAEEGDGK